MRIALLVIFFLFLLRLALAVTTDVTIQGGQVTIRGGYIDLGTTVVVSTTPSPSENAGQCIGILCGVTYN